MRLVSSQTKRVVGGGCDGYHITCGRNKPGDLMRGKSLMMMIMIYEQISNIYLTVCKMYPVIDDNLYAS